MKNLTNMVLAIGVLGAISAIPAMSDCCAQLPGGCGYNDQFNNHFYLDCGQGSCCIGVYSGGEPGGHEFGDLAVVECCPPNTTCLFTSSSDGQMHVSCQISPPLNPLEF